LMTGSLNSSSRMISSPRKIWNLRGTFAFAIGLVLFLRAGSVGFGRGLDVRAVV
jgi:hypothetical protein